MTTNKTKTDKPTTMPGQRALWLQNNPHATLEQAYTAGYFQSTENWVQKTR